MRYLLVAALLTISAIVTDRTAVYAQTAVPRSASTLSTSLVTQPASIQQMASNSRIARPYTADQLNSIVGNLQANPNAPTAPPKNAIDSLIQRFSTSNPKPTAIDPIDFFKPPALNGGVKIPLQ